MNVCLQGATVCRCFLKFSEKMYEITTFSAEDDALHRHHWVKAEPGCRYGNEEEGYPLNFIFNYWIPD